MVSAGDFVRASDVLDRVGVRVRRVATQSVNSATDTAISWDTEDEDTDGFIAVTSTTITIPTGLGGIYAISLFLQGASSLSGRCFSDIDITSAITGVPTIFRAPVEMSTETRYTNTFTGPLLAGDSFTASVFQTSGGAVTFTGWLACYRVGL